MADPRFSTAAAEFQRMLEQRSLDQYVLRLYVAGSTLRSTTAIVNLKQICEKYLKGRYQLEVVDVYQQPELAQVDQIVATPTLVKLLPLPVRRIIGDLSETDRVLNGLSDTLENE